MHDPDSLDPRPTESSLSWRDHTVVLLVGAVAGHLGLLFVAVVVMPNIYRPVGLDFCGAGIGMLTGYVPGSVVITGTGSRWAGFLVATISGAFYTGLAA